MYDNLQFIKEESREIYKEIYNVDSRKCLFATVNHPYSSPPVRLLSSAMILNGLQNDYDVTVYNWDFIKPNVLKPREELTFDAGLLAIRDENLYIFKPDVLYPFQKPHPIDFEVIKNNLSTVLANLNNIKKWKSQKRAELMLMRLDELSEIYDKCFELNTNASEFSNQLFINLMKQCGLKEESVFLENKLKSLYYDERFRLAVSRIMEILKDTELNPFVVLPNIFDKKRIFKIELNNKTIDLEPCSKYELINKENNILLSYDEILQMLKQGNIYFTQEIFNYVLYLLGVTEFGKDYDMKDKISLKIEGRPSGLQYTKSDHLSTVSYNSVISYSVTKDSMQKVSAQKLSRVNTLTSLYLHLGKNIGSYIRDIHQNIREPLSLNMSIDIYE